MPSWKRRGFAKTWPDRAQVISTAKAILMSSLTNPLFLPLFLCCVMYWWFFVDLAEFREIFSKAKRIAILTGAGVSAESGVPTFRGAGGYWRKWQAQVCNIAIRLHRSVCTNYWLLMYWSIWNWYMERLTGAWNNKTTTFSSKYSLKYGGIHYKSLCVAKFTAQPLIHYLTLLPSGCRYMKKTSNSCSVAVLSLLYVTVQHNLIAK